MPYKEVREENDLKSFAEPNLIIFDIIIYHKS